jgi:hypothetical protein
VKQHNEAGAHPVPRVPRAKSSEADGRAKSWMLEKLRSFVLGAPGTKGRSNVGLSTGSSGWAHHGGRALLESCGPGDISFNWMSPPAPW